VYGECSLWILWDSDSAFRMLPLLNLGTCEIVNEQRWKIMYYEFIGIFALFHAFCVFRCLSILIPQQKLPS